MKLHEVASLRHCMKFKTFLNVLNSKHSRKKRIQQFPHAMHPTPNQGCPHAVAAAGPAVAAAREGDAGGEGTAGAAVPRLAGILHLGGLPNPGWGRVG